MFEPIANLVNIVTRNNRRNPIISINLIAFIAQLHINDVQLRDKYL